MQKENEMPLYIRDDTVDDLAVRLMQLTSAKSKTEAVRNALVAHINTETSRKPLIERLRPTLERADKLGQINTDVKVVDLAMCHAVIYKNRSLLDIDMLK